MRGRRNHTLRRRLQYESNLLKPLSTKTGPNKGSFILERMSLLVVGSTSEEVAGRDRSPRTAAQAWDLWFSQCVGEL